MGDNIKHHFTTLPVFRSVFYAAVKRVTDKNSRFAIKGLGSLDSTLTKQY